MGVALTEDVCGGQGRALEVTVGVVVGRTPSPGVDAIGVGESHSDADGKAFVDIDEDGEGNDDGRARIGSGEDEGVAVGVGSNITCTGRPVSYSTPRLCIHEIRGAIRTLIPG